MDATKSLITNIFNNSTLVIVPFFQRSYVWKEDLWERMLDDMTYVVQSKHSHFFGSIILKKYNNPELGANYADCRTIVDGQQRLTTMLIFLKVLSLKLGQSVWFASQFRIMGQEIALRHSRRDVDAFEEVMAMEQAEEIDNSTKNARIIDAYNYFVRNVDETKMDIMTIVINTQFVRIDLEKDEDEQQIFDTINSLGVNLTTSELLKNYFFSRETISEYDSKWVSVFEKDDETKAYWETEIETGRIKRTLIDIFFDAYFQIYIQDKKYNISAEDKIVYARTEHLAQSYQDFINTYCNGNKEVVLDKIKEYAHTFRENIRPSQCDMNTPRNYGIERLNVVIFGVKVSTLIPYILYIAYNVDDRDEFDKMCGILESYIMKRLIIHATSKNYNRLFLSFILNEVKDASSLIGALDKVEDNTTFVPTDEDLKDGFLRSKLVNLQSRGILYLLESRIRPDFSSTALLGFNNYSLEHLMPKKWRNNWPSCNDEDKARLRDSKILTLGNLAIIPQALNSSIRDSDWKTKKTGTGENKPGLAKCASGLITVHDALQLDDWDEERIMERGLWLYRQARQVWGCI